MALLVSYITYTLSLTSVIVRISISTNYYNYNCYYCYNGYYYYCLISCLITCPRILIVYVTEVFLI